MGHDDERDAVLAVEREQDVLDDGTRGGVRFPVGSSAKMICGLFTRLGRSPRAASGRRRGSRLCLGLVGKSSCSRAAIPRRRRPPGATPAIFSGRIMFSRHRGVAGEEELLEHESEGLVAGAVLSRAPQGRPCPTVHEHSVPEVGASSSASTCISVDLPEPLLPTIAMHSPSRMSKLTPLSASKRFGPRP